MKPLSLSEIENTLYLLNYRWNLQALAMWQGDRIPFKAYELYEGYDDFINLETLARIKEVAGETEKDRLQFALIDHYLQRALLPHENEMRAWTRGATAQVVGENIHFREIIPWCQNSSTYEKRQLLQKETTSLCKFLKPFAVNYWKILLKILADDLGYGNYVAYCGDKKRIDYYFYYGYLKDILNETDEMYFEAMERWCLERFKRPLSELTRFDSINLLSLKQFDHLFPGKALDILTPFFKNWSIDPANTPGLTLELGNEEGKSAQAICLMLQVPEEVYVLLRPEGGWGDLETLWHELGHGLSAVFTSPHLPMVTRDMGTSFALSEAFAFLMQNLSLSTPFLEKYLDISPRNSRIISYHKTLKDIAMFRRYAAKFVAEYDMFAKGDLSDGAPYARIMKRYTGFYYQPESHLFDLVPELYCLDYVLGWMAENVMEIHLAERLGSRWMFDPEAGRILKAWWAQGNQYDLPRFLAQNRLGEMGAEAMVKRWKEGLE
ncbi:MAG: hypothetical protein LJE96_05335 [Deltaproteobacteria bacterium]|nr:hypothetical protein [Deltaproteobacteria bacterium]